MFDLVIRGGRVVDGTGATAFGGDIGVTGDRITAIGDLSMAEARDTLDAAGLVVAPGFIDIHSHSDFTLLIDPRAHSQVYQGSPPSWSATAATAVRRSVRTSRPSPGTSTATRMSYRLIGRRWRGIWPGWRRRHRR